MARANMIVRIVGLASMLIFAGCPYTVTGHVWRVNANISSRSIDQIRAKVLALGGFEGPLKVVRGSVCSEGKDYEKTLTKSGIRVRVYDCYGKSNISEAGWMYYVTVQSAEPDLNMDARNEIDALVEEIRKAVQDAVGDAKVTITEKETGYGFSLLPY